MAFGPSSEKGVSDAVQAKNGSAEELPDELNPRTGGFWRRAIVGVVFFGLFFWLFVLIFRWAGTHITDNLLLALPLTLVLTVLAWTVAAFILWFLMVQLLGFETGFEKSPSEQRRPSERGTGERPSYEELVRLNPRLAEKPQKDVLALIQTISDCGYEWDPETQVFFNRDLSRSVRTQGLDVFTPERFRKAHQRQAEQATAHPAAHRLEGRYKHLMTQWFPKVLGATALWALFGWIFIDWKGWLLVLGILVAVVVAFYAYCLRLASRSGKIRRGEIKAKRLGPRTDEHDWQGQLFVGLGWAAFWLLIVLGGFIILFGLPVGGKRVEEGSRPLLLLVLLGGYDLFLYWFIRAVRDFDRRGFYALCVLLPLGGLGSIVGMINGPAAGVLANFMNLILTLIWAHYFWRIRRKYGIGG